jgi:hypothetical protein
MPGGRWRVYFYNPIVSPPYMPIGREEEEEEDAEEEGGEGEATPKGIWPLPAATQGPVGGSKLRV